MSFKYSICLEKEKEKCSRGKYLMGEGVGETLEKQYLNHLQTCFSF